MSEELDVMGMSDEELDKLLLSDMEEEVVEDKEEAPTVEDDEENTSEQQDTNETEEEEEVEATTKTEDTSSDGEEETNTTSENEEVAEEQPAIDYQKEYEALLSSFRANGIDMQVKSVDEARTLMQMGANYSKKMTAIKPNLNIIKMLDNNDLLDTDKLSYLIDLSKKNPDAIAKLVKDSGVDPIDIDLEETKYEPNSYAVSDSEVELDQVLEAIQDTPSYRTTLDVISNQWDETSRKILVESPQIIADINDHIGSGVYKQISDNVARERILGRLTNVSDIEAYKIVGDSMDKAGAFNPENNSTKPSADNSNTQTNKTNARRKAASITRGKPSSKKAPINILEMSDEEFDKLDINNFI
jgi:hypothetical protein